MVFFVINQQGTSHMTTFSFKVKTAILFISHVLIIKNDSTCSMVFVKLFHFVVFGMQ